MFLSQCKRIIYLGLLNVVRSPFVTFSAVFVMTITLFVVGFSLLFGQVMEDTLETLRNKVDITVYFVSDTSEEYILSIRDELQENPYVENVVYISQTEALNEYLKRHENNPDLTKGINLLEGNPFRARFSIRANNTESFGQIAEFITQKDLLLEESTTRIVDKIDYYQNKNIIERLNAIVETATFFTRLIIILLIFISFLIVFNIIRLVIYLSKDEISVMRLIGAKDWYIRSPFLISGSVYGFIGAILSMLFLYPISYWLSPAVQAFFGNEGGLFVYYVASFFQVMLVLLVLGVFIGMLSSWLSTNRYLD